MKHQNTPKHVIKKLDKRTENHQLRVFNKVEGYIDFSSNDYIGFSRSQELFNETHQFLLDRNHLENGSTGSRLLTGNSILAEELETFLQEYHNVEGALLFNSGYSANLGLFSSLTTKKSIVLYDEYIHASIRDGLRLSSSKSYKFKHNSVEDLEKKLKKFSDEKDVYVSIEAVYSMDGDMPDMKAMADLCEKYGAFLIIDEAHYFGTITKEEYKVYENEVAIKALARVVTFGKAIGSHGAVVLTNKFIKSYLINYSRSLIYTTFMAPHCVASVYKAYLRLNEQPQKLKENIIYFKNKVKELGLSSYFLSSDTAIQCCVLSEEPLTYATSVILREAGYGVLPIFSPTVPKGKERLRFCIHTHNTEQEMSDVLELLKTSIEQAKKN